MMISRTKKFSCILLCVLMTFMLLPVQVFAAGIIELDQDVTLKVTYKDDSTPIAGAEFDLYRVADVDAYAYSVFTLTETFKKSGVSVNNLDSSGWRNAANTLAGYVQLNGITPLDSGITDENGTLAFPSSKNVSMKPGLYLVIGQKHTQKNIVYTAEPFLVSLPVLNEIENAWDYNGSAAPKYTSRHNPIIPITPTNPTVDRKVIKVWDDSGFEHNRPDEITAVLLRDGVVYDSAVLNAENSWTYRWDDLDADYEWTVAEQTVPDGYTVSVRREGITFVITNTYQPNIETVDKKVIKVWDDNGSTENRPSSIAAELLADGQIYDTVTLNELNNWQYQWHDLDASRSWSVREKYVPAGYTASVTQNGNIFIITNKLDKEDEVLQPVETVSRKVVKVWDDSGYEANRPAEISVELLENGQVFDTVVLNADNNWQYEWNELNKDSEWSVREASLSGNYTSSVSLDGNVFIITNTYIEVLPYIPPEPVERTVIKIWKDEGHKEERPEAVLAALLCDGEVCEIVTLNEANNWTYHWSDLPGDNKWTVCEYTVLDKYTSSVTKDGDTFIITNTYSVIPQTGQLWWPVPMLLALGLGMIVIGLVRRKGMRYEE